MDNDTMTSVTSNIDTAYLAEAFAEAKCPTKIQLKTSCRLEALVHYWVKRALVI
ncbi:hypothetical protein DM860_003821 [Cuscuta australis]|uniref:Uncharacterized protein n=1 Tax=Cuscuta australis TaxID=267555 RepID=A0A328DH27_9ASTE|nr:hypothetical protein DM860_003821 [Cuscuta australis]